MKILTVANQKGGVGKTTITAQLAFSFREKGYRVAVVDVDSQENLSYTLSDFSTGSKASDCFLGKEIFLPDDVDMFLLEASHELVDLDKRPIQEMGKSLINAMSQLERQGVDICLFDTPPSLGSLMASALIVSDFVLIPILPQTYSVMGAKKMLMTIANLKKINTKLSLIGLLPSIVDNRVPVQVENVQELRKIYPDIVLPVQLSVVGGYAEAGAKKVPVWAIKKTTARKAVKEMKALVSIVAKKMELTL